MNDTNYAACVALDWGDKQHAFALQIAEAKSLEAGQIEASPERLHEWLEELGKRCAGQPVALALEAGHPGLVHALLGYAWLTIYPVHTAMAARFRTALVPSGATRTFP